MIQFRFDTLAELWAMHGHGPYVWASYGITLAALLVLIIYPWYQQKRFLKDAALREERMRRVQKASSSSDSSN